MRTSIRATPSQYSRREIETLLRRQSSDFPSEASKSRPESIGQAYRAALSSVTSSEDASRISPTRSSIRAAQHAAPRPYSHGEIEGLDFASEASKSRPESIGQAYRASRASRRLSCSEDRRYNSSDVESADPEAMLTPTKARGPSTPTTEALQRRRVSHGEMLGLDFPSEESKDKPDSSRRLNRRPEGPKGSEVASEAINTKPERGRRIRFGECSLIESSKCLLVESGGEVVGSFESTSRSPAAQSRDADASPDLSSPHWASFTGEPGLARERAAAHSAAVTAVHAAARRERAVAAGRDSTYATWQAYLRGAQLPRDSIEWV